MTHIGGNRLSVPGGPSPWETLQTAPGHDPIAEHLAGSPELLPESGYLVTVFVDEEQGLGEVKIARYEGGRFIEEDEEGAQQTGTGATVELTNTTEAKLVVARPGPDANGGLAVHYGVRPDEAEAHFLPGSGKTLFVRRGFDQDDSIRKTLVHGLDALSNHGTMHRMVATYPEVRDVLRAVARAMWLNEGDTELFIGHVNQKLTEQALAHQDWRIDRFVEGLTDDDTRLALGGLAKAAARLRRARWTAR